MVCKMDSMIRSSFHIYICFSSVEIRIILFLMFLPFWSERMSWLIAQFFPICLDECLMCIYAVRLHIQYMTRTPMPIRFIDKEVFSANAIYRWFCDNHIVAFRVANSIIYHHCAFVWAVKILSLSSGQHVIYHEKTTNFSVDKGYAANRHCGRTIRDTESSAVG